MNPKRWEYLRVIVKDRLRAEERELQEHANALGAEGWEMCGVESESEDTLAVLWFKREL